MNSSPSIALIAAALVKAQKEMGNAKKDAVNPFFKKNYADINSIREAVLPVFNAHGITIIQPPCVVDGKNYVETIMLHESGEFISSLTEIITDKVNDAQRHGSGLSYARRYAMAAIANVGTEDDDGNKATGKTVEAYKMTPKEAKEMEKLINNSTLDATGRLAATNSVTAATTAARITEIKTKLLTMQLAS